MARIVVANAKGFRVARIVVASFITVKGKFIGTYQIFLNYLLA